MDGEHHQRFELHPLFIGLLGIFCGAVVVATFHCIAMGWCSRRRAPARPRLVRASQDDESMPSSTSNSAAQLITIHKYTDEGKESTCAVCLSEFAEGEEVRVLLDCAHSFHVQCIDMWLHSHPNCLLCRADTVPPLPPHVVVSLPDFGGAIPQPEHHGSPDSGG